MNDILKVVIVGVLTTIIAVLNKTDDFEQK